MRRQLNIFLTVNCWNSKWNEIVDSIPQIFDERALKRVNIGSDNCLQVQIRTIKYNQIGIKRGTCKNFILEEKDINQKFKH